MAQATIEKTAKALDEIRQHRTDLIDERGTLLDTKQRLLTQLALAGPQPGERKDLEAQIGKIEKQIKTVSSALKDVGLQEDGIEAERSRLQEEDRQHRTQQLEERYDEIKELIFLKKVEMADQAAGYAKLCREYMDLSGQPGAEAGKYGISLKEAGLRETFYNPYQLLKPLQEAFEAGGIRNIQLC